MKDVTTYLVDPNGLSREGWCRLLEGTSFELAHDLSSLAEFEELIAHGARPELLIVDVAALSEQPGDWGRRQRSELPDTRIVYFGRRSGHAHIADAFAGGVDGFLFTDISYEAMLQSLRLVMLGERVFPQGLIEDVMASAPRAGGQDRWPIEGTNLSRRETEILRHVAAGMANKVIAARLDVAEPTVKVHLKNILQKLRVTNRTEAAIWAISRGIGEIDTSGSSGGKSRSES